MLKKKTLLMSALAVTLAAGMTIAPAMAYFTDHTEATGSVAVELGSESTITETDVDPENWTKTLVVENKGPETVWVRATAFGGSALSFETSSANWTEGEDGYWYYSEPLPVGDKTSELVISIAGVPEDAEEVNVAVVYECTKVFYDEEGKPIAAAADADWSMDADVQE